MAAMTCHARRQGLPLVGSAHEEPVLHVPVLEDYDTESGPAPCQRCGQMVSSARWSTETCPGQPAA